MKTFKVSIMLLIFLRIICKSENQNTPLPSADGIYFDEVGNLFLSPTQWKFINYVDLHPIKELWKQTKEHSAQVLNVCHKHENKTWYFLTDCRPYEAFSKSKIKYVDSLSDVVSSYLTEPIRRKRGLFDIIGDISKVMFGTATESEIKEYQEHINTIESEQKEFLKIASEQMTVVKSAILTFNSTIFRIQANERNLAQGLKNFSEQASKSVHALEIATTTVEILNEHIRQVQRGIEESQYSFDILVDAFIHAQDGVLQPHLVTPMKIKSYMDHSKLKDDLDFPPFHISELAKLITPIIYSYKNYLVYVLQIPLVSTNQFQLYKIVPFPKQIEDNTFMYIDVTKTYIFKDSLHHKYGKMTLNELHQCFQPNDINFVCKEKTPVFTYIPNVDCEATLLHVSTNAIPSVCEKRIVKLTNTQWIPLYLSNDWLYVAPKPERFAILCPNQATNNIELKNQGRLHLSRGCKGYSATATLFASSQIEVNRTDKDILPVISSTYDCCFDEEIKSELPKLTLETPLLNILNSVDDLRMASHKVSEVENMINSEKQKKFTTNNLFHHGLTWLGSLVIILLVVVCICCSCCCCKCCRQCSFWLWDKWSPKECWEQTKSRCFIVNNYQPVVSYDVPKGSPTPSVHSLPAVISGVATEQPRSEQGMSLRPLSQRSNRYNQQVR
ncbi:hypothetical protein R5R35_001828 [Gryllus longicercus]|uniref:Envelope fusion protein n=1 Tax=Gryllus longicercus TaxID=2509291 RepID=A0AAN9VWJ5_9ORTH